MLFIPTHQEFSEYLTEINYLISETFLRARLELLP